MDGCRVSEVFVGEPRQTLDGEVARRSGWHLLDPANELADFRHLELPEVASTLSEKFKTPNVSLNSGLVCLQAGRLKTNPN